MADKILVVDDDPDTVKFINIMLSRLGYQVVAATSGMEALERVQVEHPDLIILDVMMPGMDGYEVSRNLRRNPKTATTPILMFTAKTTIEDKLAVIKFVEQITEMLASEQVPEPTGDIGKCVDCECKNFCLG